MYKLLFRQHKIPNNTMSEEHEQSFQHSSVLSITYDNSNMDYNAQIDQRIAEHLQAEQQKSLQIFEREKLCGQEQAAWNAIRREYKKHQVTNMFKSNVKKIVKSNSVLHKLIKKGYLLETGNPSGNNILRISH